MLIDVFLHTIIGCMGAATGYAVRASCKHAGWLPHPRAHVAVTVPLVFLESIVTVSLLG